LTLVPDDDVADELSFDKLHIIVINLQLNALLEKLELTDSAQSKSHFALYNCLVL
jgi:hypothetical protein